jgi:hypothetical protein
VRGQSFGDETLTTLILAIALSAPPAADPFPAGGHWEYHPVHGTIYVHPLPGKTPAAAAPAVSVDVRVQVTGEGDGLAEVNARRARSGLPPYLRDPLLTAAARGAAAFRAARLMFGHTQNDFAFIPAGGHARAAGCAAYHLSYGWMSCGVEDRTARYAGAYWVTGRDGRRFMHLFLR